MTLALCLRKNRLLRLDRDVWLTTDDGVLLSGSSLSGSGSPPPSLRRNPHLAWHGYVLVDGELAPRGAGGIRGGAVCR